MKIGSSGPQNIMVTNVHYLAMPAAKTVNLLLAVTTCSTHGHLLMMHKLCLGSHHFGHFNLVNIKSAI